MNQLVSFLFILLLTLILFQCAPYKPEGQGVIGQVTWLAGNQMPTITTDGKNKKKTTGSEQIKRIVRVYPLVKISDVTLEDGLFKSVAAKPITEVESDENGQYSINLSPGRYTILIVEEGGLFANIFDGEGNIQPVTVRENEWTLLDIVVNYRSVY